MGLGRIRTRLGPWLVWLATVGGAVAVWSDMRHGPPVVGFVEGASWDVAPLAPARVERLAVGLGQEVAAGQVLAVLDASALDAEIAVVEAERAQAEAELEAARAAWREDASSTARDLAAEEERVERALAEARADLAGARAELRAQRAERDRLRPLVAERLADRDALAALETRVATLEGRADGAKARIDVLERQVEAARARREAAGGGGAQVVVAPLQRTLDVIDGRLAALRQQRAARVLRVPSAGRVAAILRRPGAVAGPDAPVLSVVSADPGRIVACVAEEQALDVQVGDRATVWTRQRAAVELHGQVVALGPLVGEVPPRCRPNLRDRAWGRDVVVLLDDPVALLPGQALDVRLEPAGPRPGARAAGQPAAAEGPPAMAVPAALRARSRLEPSGAVWVPRLHRYVMVSDDTGIDGTPSEDAPWLFSMDAGGAVDADPRPVVGAERFVDLESLAPGPGDTLYALASQSPSRRGRLPPARTAFWRFAPEGAGFHATGRVELAPLLDALPEAARAALGVEGADSVDLEGLTAFEGGLLVGVKTPVDAEGRALIWRLAHPQRLLDTGRLDEAGLAPWGRVALTVDTPSGPVPGGVAELLALPDGGLVVAATPSDPAVRDAAGALWRVDRRAGGELSARRVATFPGLKPEGLALAPTDGRLLVVFDAGSAPPRWLELDWPPP